MSALNIPTPVKLFFSYAHEDEDLRNGLEEHLAILKRKGIISTWHDRKIGAGREWASEISNELESAQIILLLVSSSFIASDYCYSIEMDRALKRHKNGEALVIPIIIRPVFWEDAPFGKLQALPSRAKPVTKWGNRDEAFKDIAKGVADSVSKFTNKNISPKLLRSVDSDENDANNEPTPTENITAVIQNIKFVRVYPGSFLMGSKKSKRPEEKPQREITILHAFYMGAYVVTQEEWRAIMKTEPWKGREFVRTGRKFPAVYVSWADAKTFISRLNSLDSENYYRLPTEAEWEYAARAGTSTDFSFGDDAQQLNAYGWYIENSYDAGFRHPHEVGLKRPNDWGLYDMHGNIWEWVEDWYYGSYLEKPNPNPDEKILRGGGYDFSANGARSAFRNKLSPIRSNHVIGFRLIKEPL